MKKSVWIITGLIVIVVLILIFSGGQSQAPTSPTGQTPGTPPAKAAPRSATVILTAQNKSGESGTAKLMEENGKVRVTVKLTGAPVAAEPAHIHLGSCPTPGAVKYPLTNVIQGNSETVLTISFAELMANLPLAVNVHKSGTDLKTYVACGNIVK